MKRPLLLIAVPLLLAVVACAILSVQEAAPLPPPAQPVTAAPSPLAALTGIVPPTEAAAPPEATALPEGLPSALSGTPTDAPAPSPTPLPPPTPIFRKWSSDQALLMLGAAGLKLGPSRPAGEADLGGAPLLAPDAAWVDLSQHCRECSAQVFSFAAAADLQATHGYYASLGERYLYAKDNLLVRLDPRLPERQARKFETALAATTLRSVLEAYNQDPYGLESWQEYYPTDRGHALDPATGRGQRTYNRWEGDGLWYFGQSTWRYQDPSGSDAPPATFPADLEGDPLHYFYNYQCEPNPKEDPLKDCLNWQIYIELLGNTDDPTKLMNWARGGWKSIKRKPAEWEVFYKLEAFDGVCDEAYIRDHFDDAYLQRTDLKAPLLFSLPDQAGATFSAPEVCAVVFNSYLERTRFIKYVERWRTTTTTLSKTYDAATDRYVINAENRYYKFAADAGGDTAYTQWAHEVYWMRQLKPETPLGDGFEAFWWFTWDWPPEENLDRDNDTTWSPFQWCRVDPSAGPAGLGELICEP